MSPEQKSRTLRSQKRRPQKRFRSYFKDLRDFSKIHRYTEKTVAESKLFNVDMSSGQFIEKECFSNPFTGDRDDRIFNDKDDRISLKYEDKPLVTTPVT